MAPRKSSRQSKVAGTTTSDLPRELLTEAAYDDYSAQSAKIAEAYDELRQQAEALSEARIAAEKEQQRYQQLFDFAPDGNFVTNLDGIIKMANHAAAVMLGVEIRFVTGKPLAIFISPEQRLFFRTQLHRIKNAGAPERWETRLHPREAPEIDVMISVVRSFSPLAEDSCELLWQIQDLTEVKEQEKAEREKYFRATFEQSPLGMGHLDREGKWLQVNPKLCQLFGYSGDELERLSILDLTVAEERQLTTQLLEEIVAGEHEILESETRYLHRSGEIIWAHIHMTAVRAPSEEFLYSIIVLEDITERKRIEAAESEQRLITTTLRETALLLTSSLDFSEVTDQILLNIGRVVPHDAASFLLIQGESAYVVRARGYGRLGASLQAELEDFHISITESDRIEQMLRTHKPVVVPYWEEHGSWDQVPGMMAMQSLVAVPILNEDEVIGFLKLHSRTSNFFTEEHAALLQVFASEAAIAIRNAQAYEQAQTLAVLNERHRLARELHDAVTQTLFSVNVIADSLPRLWKDMPDPIQTQLQHLQMLSRGALAEMRTLLLELRPEYLSNIVLETQLQQLLDAVKVRKRMNAKLVAQVEAPIPPPVRIAFYRITQEALNNVIKHAHATEVQVTLTARQECTQLVVQDNGIGFEYKESLPGFGLHTMSERAKDIDARLEVETLPKAGTRIRVTWEDVPEDRRDDPNANDSRLDC